MIGLKRVMIGFGLIGMIWLHAGCAQVVVPGTVAGAGEFYRYATRNVAKQTFVGNMNQTVNAARSALDRMKIELVNTDSTDTETILYAETPEMEIILKFQSVTSSVTRTRIDTKKGHWWIKDKATAEEILSQIVTILKAETVPQNRLSKILIKNECNRSIRVAVYYLAGSEGSQAWEAKGWFYISPASSKQIAESDNRYVYIYAESISGKTFRWSGDEMHEFKGKSYGFFKIDMGPKIVDFTQTLTCK